MKIQPLDLVMKGNQCFFHVDCFRCKVCDVLLKKGDYFGWYEDVPYCQLHHELIVASTSCIGRENPNTVKNPASLIEPQSQNTSVDAFEGASFLQSVEQKEKLNPFDQQHPKR